MLHSFNSTWLIKDPYDVQGDPEQLPQGGKSLRWQYDYLPSFKLLLRGQRSNARKLGNIIAQSIEAVTCISRQIECDEGVYSVEYIEFEVAVWDREVLDQEAKEAAIEESDDVEEDKANPADLRQFTLP